MSKQRSTQKDRTSTDAESSPGKKYSRESKTSATASDGERTRPDARRRKRSAQAAAQKNEADEFFVYQSDLCDGLEEPAQTSRLPRMPLRDVLFGAVLKQFWGVAGRRLTSFLKRAHGDGYLSRSPDFNTITKYVDSEVLTPHLYDLVVRSSLPLRDLETEFIPDSSGFGTGRFVRWFNIRWGKEQDNHDWEKVRVMIGALTHIVTSVRITDRHAHDSRFLAPLLGETALGFKVSRVIADKGYSTKKNLRLVEGAGAEPFILFKSNTTGRGKCPVWNRGFHFFRLHEEEFLEIYHKRSNVESTFSSIKRKFSVRLRRRTKTGQINEVLCCILAHNVCVMIRAVHEFGVDPKSLWSKSSPDSKVA